MDYHNFNIIVRVISGLKILQMNYYKHPYINSLLPISRKKKLDASICSGTLTSM